MEAGSAESDQKILWS